MATIVAGNGLHGWVWEAIASGDVNAVRAAPHCFEVNGFHPKHGGVLTAFLQGALNLDGRFIGCSAAVVKDLVEELGLRGARPGLVIPDAHLDIEGLYKSWQFRGDITPMQVAIQLRNDYLSLKWSQEAGMTSKDVEDFIKLLNDLIDTFATLEASSPPRIPRCSIPSAIVDIWQMCRSDATTADVDLLSPDGCTKAHSIVLKQASPVLLAMLGSSMTEGCDKIIRIEEPASSVKLFLNVLYTGCLPDQCKRPALTEVHVGLRITVAEAFKSSNERNKLLTRGLEGEVAQIDNKGDALVKFDRFPARQWISKKNFSKLCLPDDGFEDLLHMDFIHAFHLVHRWQISGLAEVLSARLETGLRATCFAITLEAAVLHNAQHLFATCISFAYQSQQVRNALEAKTYPDIVLQALTRGLEGWTCAEINSDQRGHKRSFDAL